MVNEINKPPSSDNIILGERLAASNRQLNEMQEEHRQLLQEMAVLRQRATELSHLSAQQNDDNVETRLATEGNVATEVIDNTTNEVGDNSTIEVVDNSAITVADMEIPAETESPIIATPEIDSVIIPIVKDERLEEDVDDDEDPEAAEYLRQKIAEIASLKAQFKRVQHIMNATDLIEQHIASKGSETTKEEEISTNSSTNIINAASPTPAPAPEADPAISLTMNLLQATDFEQTTHRVNEHDELLSAMMNMFSEFTSDLRSQADNLRAERDRLRALKEELMRRKRQSTF